ncbi:MAG TPA: hypothetical protein VLX68_04260 [Chitinivibrionales bacterium]|nr:hypothetical protein [Chitinivibrionales bacterium]
MKHKVLAICLLLLACSNKINGPVLPALVNFMPAITVGDTWIYSVKGTGTENAWWNSNFTKTIVVMKVTRLDSITTMFDVTIRDSGLIYCISDTCPPSTACYPNCPPSDTTYLVDSIIETPDTVIDKTGYFTLSTRTTSSWGLESRGTYKENFGYYRPFQNLVEYIQISGQDDFTIGSFDTTVFLENVGLVFKYHHDFDEDLPFWYIYSIALVSFNGKTPEQISQEPR